MARYPAVFIVVSVVMTVAASFGFLVMEEETDGLKLWSPQDSEFTKNTVWLQTTFPSNSRFSSIIIVADNVLEPEIVRQTFALLKEIKNIKNSTSGTSLWEQKCMRTAFQKCLEMSILEAFMTPAHEYDEAAISGLSSVEEVRGVMNTAAASGVTGGPFTPASYLGSIEYSGQEIVSAKAMQVRLLGVNGEGGQEGDDVTMLFEEKLIAMVNDRSFTGGMTAYPLTMRSFGDIIGGSIGSDLNVLAAGYLLIFVYVLINLGKLNAVEHRVWLSVGGVVAVLMGVATSFGLAAFMGVFSSGMNQLLPFLMLGIGIDDMFVIMQAFESLNSEECLLPLPERMGLTMKHAGVAITITSITDLLAFAIGATTVLPALSSFCIYAALGILFIYLYAISFFLAWFSLDQKRVEATRDGCICCWKRQNWSPSACSQRSLFKRLFEQVSDIAVLVPAKVTVFVVTLGILAGGIYGAVTLDTEFDQNAFVEDGTYLKTYLELTEMHFSSGTPEISKIYFTDLDYAADMENIWNLLGDLNQLATKDKSNISPGSVKSWLPGFVTYVNQKRAAEFGSATLPTYKGYSNSSFQTDISEFLGDPILGGTYRADFKYSADIDYSKPAPQILLSTMSYQHVLFDSSADGVSAMKDIFAMVDKHQFSANVFASSQGYSSYITIDIINAELFRNTLMALGVVFICTLVLIADLATSLIVLLTVALTVINVAGYANFWGLTIDTIFAIFMTISIGLCVDYSAHIAHGFMVEEGTREQRMRRTMVNVGPAVLNGGISTFLAFCLLCTSRSYIFLTFFKVFFLVVVFGLFHGLIFLPVLLSIVGPSSHGHQDDNLHLNNPTAIMTGKENGGFLPDQMAKHPVPLTSMPSLPGSADTSESALSRDSQ